MQAAHKEQTADFAVEVKRQGECECGVAVGPRPGGMAAEWIAQAVAPRRKCR